VTDEISINSVNANLAMRRTIGTRSERVRELIEEGIATGEFPPGMRLDETELADRFDVSRTPLREALFQLASAGIAFMVKRIAWNTVDRWLEKADPDESNLGDRRSVAWFAARATEEETAESLQRQD
jgi:DNA-binding FadR family transcriptional regulator